MEQKSSCQAVGLAALTLLLAATPAAAQSIVTAKSEAGLGGPSQLAAIIAAQAAGAAPAAISRLPAFAVRPAALTVPAVFKTAATASPSRPDIFNSVALPIARSPLDARWNRVEAVAVAGRAALFAAALSRASERSRIEAVNAYVNARVAFTNDSRQFGVADRWSTVNETLARGRGDCEDYALAKLAMLRRAGIAKRDLYFVVLKDVARRADHAVLVVRSEGRFLVLDNGIDRLRDSDELVDYRPVLTFTAGQRFLHGYRRSAAPPVVLASNTIGLRRWGADGMPSSPFASR